MLNKKSVKIISIILLSVILLLITGNVVFANSAAGGTVGGGSVAIAPNTSVIAGQGGPAASIVLGTLKWAGVAIAIGMMIFLGIKYVTSSPEGKANLKGQLGIYILGLVFITSAVGIVTVLETILSI